MDVGVQFHGTDGAAFSPIKKPELNKRNVACVQQRSGPLASATQDGYDLVVPYTKDKSKTPRTSHPTGT